MRAVLMMIGFVLMLGAEGGLQQETIGLGVGIILMSVGLLLMVIGLRGDKI